MEAWEEWVESMRNRERTELGGVGKELTRGRERL